MNRNMDSGSKNLTFRLKNGGKLLRKHLGSSHSSQSQNLQNKMILGFISNLNRDCLAMAPPVCPRGPALVGIILPQWLARKQNVKLRAPNPNFTTHLHPTTLRKHQFTLRSISRVLLARIQFHKVVQVPNVLVIHSCNQFHYYTSHSLSDFPRLA